MTAAIHAALVVVLHGCARSSGTSLLPAVQTTVPAHSATVNPKSGPGEASYQFADRAAQDVSRPACGCACIAVLSRLWTAWEYDGQHQLEACSGRRHSARLRIPEEAGY